MKMTRKNVRRQDWVEGLEARVLLTALPAGFRETVVTGGLGAVTAMDVLPDGRVLVSEQMGTLAVVPASPVGGRSHGRAGRGRFRRGCRDPVAVAAGRGGGGAGPPRAR